MILDDAGNVVGSKPRKDIDKVKDAFWCSDVLVFDGNHQLLLSKIPVNNLYAGLWGSTTATILRENENPEDAAIRVLHKELGIENASPTKLGEKFFIYADGVKRKKSTYFIVSHHELRPNPEDIAELKAWNRSELESFITSNPEQFAPTFLGIWESVKEMIPSEAF